MVKGGRISVKATLRAELVREFLSSLPRSSPRDRWRERIINNFVKEVAEGEGMKPVYVKLLRSEDFARLYQEIYRGIAEAVKQNREEHKVSYVYCKLGEGDARFQRAFKFGPVVLVNKRYWSHLLEIMHELAHENIDKLDKEEHSRFREAISKASPKEAEKLVREFDAFVNSFAWELWRKYWPRWRKMVQPMLRRSPNQRTLEPWLQNQRV